MRRTDLTSTLIIQLSNGNLALKTKFDEAVAPGFPSEIFPGFPLFHQGHKSYQLDACLLPPPQRIIHSNSQGHIKAPIGLIIYNNIIKLKGEGGSCPCCSPTTPL
jgi:hypothetical protein